MNNSLPSNTVLANEYGPQNFLPLPVVDRLADNPNPNDPRGFTGYDMAFPPSKTYINDAALGALSSGLYSGLYGLGTAAMLGVGAPYAAMPLSAMASFNGAKAYGAAERYRNGKNARDAFNNEYETAQGASPRYRNQNVYGNVGTSFVNMLARPFLGGQQ